MQARPGAPGAGAASGAGPSAASGTNILSGERDPLRGLGAAFISGYYCGINTANYLKNL